MIKRILSIFFAFSVFHSLSYAQILLPKVFGENMVLQRGIRIPIWGSATPVKNILKPR